MAKLNDTVREILTKPNHGFLATLMPDGTPQVTQVWVDVSGDRVRVNTAEGRVKPRNVRNDPRVGLAVYNADNPYAAVSIRGRVVNVTDDGADAHIDSLAKKYLGQDTYPFRQPGEQRLIIEIEPDAVFPAG